MPRYASSRLVQQLQRTIAATAYTDKAEYFAVPSADTGLDRYGQPTQSTVGVLIDCNFTDAIRNRSNVELFGEEADISHMDAEVRFAQVPVTPTKGGKFKLISKHDDSASIGTTFEVVNVRNRGVFGWVCALRKVEL